jgi:methyl-accepting chemotaxis protein
MTDQIQNAPPKPRRKPASKGLGTDPLDRIAPPAPATPLPPAPSPRIDTMNDLTPIAKDDSRTWETVSAADALNVLTNPITIADADYVIRYANESAYKMFELIEADIRRDLPHFRAREVVGKSVDVFHKDPAHQRRIMDGMTEVHNGKFTVGGKHLGFRATPVFGASGKLASVFVEWKDLTAELEAKANLDKLLQAIRDMSEAHENGIISHFINVDEMSSEMRIVAEGANKMVAGHIATKKKILACVAEFGKGNFDAQMEKLSGERYFINDIIEDIRSAFKKVTSEVERFCTAVDRGDLAIEINRDGFTGDYRKIVDTMELALVSLNKTMTTATQQVAQVAITVDQMSQASQSLATNSQIASSSVDQVSSSTEETSIQVKSNATAADAAAKLVGSTVVVANDGNQKITDMVAAMEGIRVSSQDIAKIIKVIDEIAFQTNLLALNAAVEAARAGQHGRGFAVVAQEVRNLAGRSAKAARETSELIEDASTRVQSGVRIAGEARDSFTRIATDIQEVQSLVGNIAVASEEQARGVVQINAGIGEVAKAALATSQQADELAASATEMQSATEIMRRDFNRFKLRKVTQAKTAGTGLADMSPELLAQMRAMFMAEMGEAKAPMANFAGNSTSQPRGSVDRDERGFGNF